MREDRWKDDGAREYYKAAVINLAGRNSSNQFWLLALFDTKACRCSQGSAPCLASPEWVSQSAANNYETFRFSLVFTRFERVIQPPWGAADTWVNAPSAKNQQFAKSFSFKPRADQSILLHASPSAGTSVFLIFAWRFIQLHLLTIVFKYI